jgi:hypothetical protein
VNNESDADDDGDSDGNDFLIWQRNLGASAATAAAAAVPEPGCVGLIASAVVVLSLGSRRRRVAG